jgi:hypothetical protein
MTTRIPALLLCFALAACGGSAESESMADTESSVASTTLSVRPDALNPNGDPEAEVPTGWMTRFDRAGDYTVGANPDSADVFFVTMTPGWHVTTEPSGIFWHPASTASGTYTASTTIHLFPPGERNEAHGLIFGGSDLSGPNQAYLYFVVRRSGEFLVKRRAGDDTETLVDWTANEAVVPFTDETESTAENTLAVSVEADQVVFFVNDTEVASLPREGLVTDGIVGLRINHGLNVHVADLSVEQTGA